MMPTAGSFHPESEHRYIHGRCRQPCMSHVLHCSTNNTRTNGFPIQVFYPNSTGHISQIPGEWSLVVEAATLFGDETTGLLASWSFCSSFFVPIYSLKRETERKQTSYNWNSNTNCLWKGRFDKRQTEQSRVQMMCCYAHHPQCLRNDTLVHSEENCVA